MRIFNANNRMHRAKKPRNVPLFLIATSSVCKKQLEMLLKLRAPSICPPRCSHTRGA
jgi:hypothetical protein